MYNLIFTGAVHPELLKKTVFREPLLMNEECFNVYCRMSKEQFINFSMTNVPALTKRGELNVYAETLLFLIKICHGTPFQALAKMFSFKNHTSASRIFYRILAHQYMNNVSIPVLINEQGIVNDGEVDKFLNLAYDQMSPYFKTLVSYLEDPTGQNREAVLINLDATYIQIRYGLTKIKKSNNDYI